MNIEKLIKADGKINLRDIINFSTAKKYDEASRNQLVKMIIEKNLKIYIDEETEREMINNHIEKIKKNRSFLKYNPKNLSNEKQMFKELSCYPILNRFEEYFWFSQYEKGNMDAKEIVINSNHKLVIEFLKRKFDLNSSNFHDFFQEAMLSLYAHFDKFDYKKGYKFFTYMAYYINLDVGRNVKYKENIIRVPYNIYAIQTKLFKLNADFYKKNQRKMTATEIQESLNLNDKEMYSLKLAMESTNLIYLDKKQDDMLENHELIAGINDNYFEDQDEDVIAFIKKNETDMKEVILRYGIYTGEFISMKEVGEILGYSKQNVDQKLNKQLARIRSKFKVENKND